MLVTRAPALSSAQAGLWLSERIQPGNPVYNVGEAWRLEGPVDVERLSHALSLVVERHEPLRTVISEIGGRPRRTTARSGGSPLMCLPQASWGEALEEAVKLIRAPFDLKNGPVLRAWLWPIADAGERQVCLLVLAIHHIAVDGWSMGVFTRELAALYRGQALSPLSLTYADHVEREQAWLSSEEAAAASRYWVERLADEITPLDLPADRPRPAASTHDGARFSFEVSPELRVRLTRLAHAHRASLFMAVYAALAAWLYRLSGQEDVCIGVPSANRAGTDEEQLIGLFLNKLVMRSTISSDEPFLDLFVRCRGDVLDAFEHQDIPFERLVELVNPRRSLAYSPLFQVLLAFQNYARPALELEGIDVSPVSIDPGTAKYDLSLFCDPEGEGLQCFFEYNTDVFDSDTIAAWARSFLALLDGVVDNPTRRVGRLPMLSGEDLRFVLVDGWNSTDVRFPQADRRLDQLFEAQVARAPSSRAIGDRTYGQLDERVQRLAQTLCSAGVGRGSLVGLALPASTDAVEMILALWKVGAAYLPLDPTDPAERIREVVARARPCLVVRGLEAWEPLEASATVSEGIAYLMATSGSTGRPKDVLGTHRATVNRLAWMESRWPHEPGQPSCARTALGFVDSVAELFGPLLAGGRLVIASSQERHNLEALCQLLGREAIARVVVVPTLLRRLLEVIARDRLGLEGLRLCVSSGEVLSGELAQRFRSLLPGARLLNLYGSTEVTGDVAAFEVGARVGEMVPIGSPVANTRLYLLDRHGEPVAPGMAGEISVGGAALSAGYLHEGSPQRFVTHPTLGRLYATGDRGRFRHGQLDYLGRLDRRMKLSGYRLDPEEVEQVLTSHPGVAEAVVVSPGPGLLVAHVVPARSGELPGDLWSWTRARLPSWMVPAKFELHRELPRAPSGKPDLARLSNVGPQDSSTADGPPVAGGVSEAPNSAGNAVEGVIRLFEEVLGLAELGPNSDFFALGGSSLLALRLSFRMQEELGASLQLSDYFEAPTPAAIARRLGECSSRTTSVRRIQAGQGGLPVFLLPTAEGVPVAGYRRLASFLGPETTCYALGLDDLQPEDLVSIHTTARRYLIDIRKQTSGPVVLAGLCLGGILAWEIARQMAPEQPLVIMLDAYGLDYPKVRPRGILSRTITRAGWALRKLTFHLWALGRLRPSQRRDYLASRILYKLTSRLPDDPICQRVRQCVLAYRPGIYAGPVIQIRASEQPCGSDPDPTLGWAPYCSGPLSLVEVPGIHGATLLEEPVVQLIAAHIRKGLIETFLRFGGSSG